MKIEDIGKLSKGLKIQKDIKSVESQIESVKLVNIIKLFKQDNTWPIKYGSKNEQVNFDIPIDNQHPYSDKAKEFLDSYIEFLKEKKILLEQEFDTL